MGGAVEFLADKIAHHASTRKFRRFLFVVDKVGDTGTLSPYQLLQEGATAGADELSCHIQKIPLEPLRSCEIVKRIVGDAILCLLFPPSLYVCVCVCVYWY